MHRFWTYEFMFISTVIMVFSKAYTIRLLSQYPWGQKTWLLNSSFTYMRSEIQRVISVVKNSSRVRIAQSWANFKIVPFDIGPPHSAKCCVSAGMGISRLVWASPLVFDQPDCVIFFFLISNQNFTLRNLCPWPPVLYESTSKMSLAPLAL